MKNPRLECGVMDLLVVVLISMFVPVKSDVAAMIDLMQSLNNQLSTSLTQVNESVSSNGNPGIGNNALSPAAVVSTSSSGAFILDQSDTPIGNCPEPSGPSTDSSNSSSPVPEPSGPSTGSSSSSSPAPSTGSSSSSSPAPSTGSSTSSSPAPEPSGPSTGSSSPAPEPSGSGSPDGTHSGDWNQNSKSFAPAKIKIIVGVITAGVLVFLAGLLGFCFYRKKQTSGVLVFLAGLLGFCFYRKKQTSGVLVFLAGLLGFCFYRKKQKKFARLQDSKTMVVNPHHFVSNPETAEALSENYNWPSTGPSEIQMGDTGNMAIISIQVLRNATNNFSEDYILGRGGFGIVYKGELDEGTKIAVKRMNSGIMTKKGYKEFESEIDVLTKVRHRHLVALLGYCLDGNERLLVFEHMPQGTLSRHLFNWKEEGLMPLRWSKRLSIALDVARGVEYLHGLAHQSFIHRDLKPSNILLGDDMRAKVADFGLVRLVPEGKASIETRLAGTFGYLAPEYATTGRVTTKVDVFSFGVILMELITGRKAIDEAQSEDDIHLVTWFMRMYINKDTFYKAIDPTIDLNDQKTLASINTVVELAGHCCAREPRQRPNMGHVVSVLTSLAEVWKPSNPDSEDIYGIQIDNQGTCINSKRRRMARAFMSFRIPSFFRNSSLSENSLPSMVLNSV